MKLCLHSIHLIRKFEISKHSEQCDIVIWGDWRSSLMHQRFPTIRIKGMSLNSRVSIESTTCVCPQSILENSRLISSQIWIIYQTGYTSKRDRLIWMKQQKSFGMSNANHSFKTCTKAKRSANEGKKYS